MTAPHLIQTVHVFGRCPRLLREHLEQLERSGAELFDLSLRLDAAETEQRIVRLLDTGRYPADRSSYVRMELRSDGTLDLRPDATSIYRGYVLRALHPDAVTLRFDTPFPGHATSAAEAAWELAREMAEARRVRSVVRTDGSGTRIEADGAPLFIVRGREIFTAAPPAGVTGQLAVEAIRRAGYALHTEPAGNTAAPDELFYADHRGITAIKRCDGDLLMAIIASRVAREMERIWEKP